MIWAYLAGLVTLPALAGIGAFVYAYFMPDSTTHQWCDYCEWQTFSRRRFVRYVSWRIHTFTKAHRAGKLLGPAWKRKPQPEWVGEHRHATFPTERLIPTSRGSAT